MHGDGTGLSLIPRSFYRHEFSPLQNFLPDKTMPQFTWGVSGPNEAAHIRAEWSSCVARQPYISIPRAHPVSGAAKLGDMKLAALCAPPQTLINQGSHHCQPFLRRLNMTFSSASLTLIFLAPATLSATTLFSTITA